MFISLYKKLRYSEFIEKILSFIPDKLFLQLMYRRRMHKFLNLNQPKTFTEKLQWLKLNDRRQEYTTYVDKYKVREHIAKTIGQEYLIPLLGVWDNPDEIDFEKLPNQFVLKCNHDSGSIFIAKNNNTFKHKFAKKNLSREIVIEKLNNSIRKNYYWSGREWCYKNIDRKIIAEENIEKDEPITEYKWYCFQGKPIFCERIFNNKSDGDRIIDGYDFEWNLLDYQDVPYKNSGKMVPKPLFLDEMLNISRKLSFNIPFIRIDFLYNGNRLYIGELTFFESGGYIEYNPKIWDIILGSYLKLPTDKKFTVPYQLLRR